MFHLGILVVVVLLRAYIFALVSFVSWLRTCDFVYRVGFSRSCCIHLNTYSCRSLFSRVTSSLSGNNPALNCERLIGQFVSGYSQHLIIRLIDSAVSKTLSGKFKN